MHLKLRVISQQPPGGRCTLYAGYAQALVDALGFEAEVAFSTARGAHGAGFPTLLLNEEAIQPEDGAILMPADVCVALAAAGLDAARLDQAAAALDAPLQRLLGSQ